jgi:hypothetical protein
MEAVTTSAMSVKFYETTWHSNSKDCHLHTENIMGVSYFFLLSASDFILFRLILNELAAVFSSQLFSE